MLRDAGVLNPRGKESKGGKGFQQPLAAHEHWHVDVACINICGFFCFPATVVDGLSRTVVNWAIGEKMESADLQILLQEAAEKFSTAKPRIISNNGPQFIANAFKTFVKTLV